MTRYTRIVAGQDNWNARTGYQDRCRIDGPLLPMDDRLPGDGELQHWLPWITLASSSIVAAIAWGLLS